MASVFVTQLRLMLWKQWLVKKRMAKQTVLEIAIPLFFFSLLVVIRLSTQGGSSWKAASFPQATRSLSADFQYFQSCESKPQFQLLNALQALGYYADDDSDDCTDAGWPHWTMTGPPAAVESIGDYLRTAENALPPGCRPDPGQCGNFTSSFVPFASQGALDAYIQSAGYAEKDSVGAIALAIDITQWDAARHQFKYVLRVNSAAVPDVESVLNLINKEAVKSCPANDPAETGQAYMCNGLLMVQMVLDQAALDMSHGSATGERPLRNRIADWNREPDTLDFQLMAYPSARHFDDVFLTVIKSLLPWFLLLGFLYPFTQTVKKIVEEKEARLKEGLKIQGLTDAVFWLHWIISSVLTFGISALAATAIFSIWIFPLANPFLIFLFCFGLVSCLIALACVLTTPFDNPKTAARAASFLYFALFLPAIIIHNTSQPSPQLQRGMSLLAPALATWMVGVLANSEQAQIGVNFGNLGQKWNGFSFGEGLVFLLIDTVLFGLLAWYLDQVLPKRFGVRKSPFFFLSRFGVRKSPFFFLSRSFWCSEPDEPHSSDLQLKQLAHSSDPASQNENVEPVSDALRAQLAAKGVVLSNLNKVFSASGGDVHAVQDLSLEMFPGQVLCLLGHNGAGKTTTIDMLTGMKSVTSGSATIAGRDVRTQMDTIRRHIGVCPQHDVLWPRLTVAEHLRIFAQLKHVPAGQVEAAVLEKVRQVGLTEKFDAETCTLSGGQKRKLSVAIALIGKSDIVFLDEPTSGMDPYSRRATWNLIRESKKDRVIVLTTHFMDEADILADRIAIMSHGRLRIAGTSMFLKSRFGVGYNLSLTKTSRDVPTGAVESLLREHCSSSAAGLEVISDVGTELAFRVPFSESKHFADLFDEFDARKETLGLASYSISVTTLEEVFLRINEEDKLTATTTAETPVLTAATDKNSTTTDATDDSKLYQAGVDDDTANNNVMTETLLSVEESTPVIGGERASLADRGELWILWRQFMALFAKRFHIAKRDRRSQYQQWLVPILTVFLSLGLSYWLHANPAAHTLDLTTSALQTDPVAVNAVDLLSSSHAHSANFTAAMHAVDGNLRFTSLTTQTARNLSHELLAAAAAGGGPTAISSLASIGFVPSNMTLPGLLATNISVLHAFPILVNDMNRARLRLQAPDSSHSYINARLHPFPLNGQQKKATAQGEGFSTALVFMIGFAFYPVACVYILVQERQSKAKHQQLISGVSPIAYWLATFAWDCVNYLIPFGGGVILIAAFQPAAFYAGSHLAASALAIFMFCPAACAFIYNWQALFDNPATAQNVTLLLFMVSPILLIVVFILTLVGVSGIETVRMIARVLFPNFAFGDALLYMYFNYSCGQTGVSCVSSQFTGGSPFQWHVIGADVFIMGMQAGVYLVLAITVEHVRSLNWSLFASDPAVPDFSHTDDDDVAAEQRRIKDGHGRDDIVQLQGLRKTYAGRGNAPAKAAVKDMWFGVRQGECFGFLGINGAGKTSTLAMLSGEFAPTQGRAFLGGFDIAKQPAQARRLIGYCPQFDAHFELMTPREHLTMYARVKGVLPAQVGRVVAHMLDSLQLRQYADKTSRTLSGGNRRKLSVAMALVGSPRILFLDEPSTGVDPVARRWMWQFISSTMADRAVVLTTHSMEEAEALAHRIGIMVSGRLKCIGSAQHLKRKFGRGFQLDLKVTCESDDKAADAQNVDALKSRVLAHFGGGDNGGGGCVLLEHHDQSLKFEIGDAHSLPGVFRALETIRADSAMQFDYAVSQTSLEQVFIGFAREQLEEQGHVQGMFQQQAPAPVRGNKHRSVQNVDQ